MDSHTAHSNGSASDEVTLRVPGEDRFLELVRSVVGRVARISGFTYSGIEDFSLAVDEAAVLLLEKAPTSLSLRICEMGQGTKRISVVVSVHEPGEAWPPSHNLGSDMRWQVLTALCEDVWLVDGDEVGIGLAQSIR